MDTTSLIGSCGAVGVGITVLPTILLVVSEVLGVSKGKSNGIVHFVFCIIDKIKNKEPIREEEVFECLRNAKKIAVEIQNDIEVGEKIDDVSEKV